MFEEESCDTNCSMDVTQLEQPHSEAGEDSVNMFASVWLKVEVGSGSNESSSEVDIKPQQRCKPKRVMHHTNQSYDVVYNVYKYMQQQANEALTVTLSRKHLLNPEERTAEATGISVEDLRRILNNDGSGVKKKQKSTKLKARLTEAKLCENSILCAFEQAGTSAAIDIKNETASVDANSIHSSNECSETKYSSSECFKTLYNASALASAEITAKFANAVPCTTEHMKQFSSSNGPGATAASTEVNEDEEPMLSNDCLETIDTENVSIHANPSERTSFEIIKPTRTYSSKKKIKHSESKPPEVKMAYRSRILFEEDLEDEEPPLAKHERR